jgi:hypothetical protein
MISVSVSSACIHLRIVVWIHMYTVALFAISPTSFWSQNVVSDSAASALLSLVRRLPDISAVRSLVTPGTGACPAADVVGGSMVVTMPDQCET